MGKFNVQNLFTHGNRLIIPLYKIKSKLHVSDRQWHIIHIAILKGKIEAWWGNAGPKQEQNPAGQTCNPLAPLPVLKVYSVGSAFRLCSLQHTSVSWARSTPWVQLTVAAVCSSGTSSILESPTQLRFHTDILTKRLLKASVQGGTPLPHTWPQVLYITPEEGAAAHCFIAIVKFCSILK